MKHRLKTAALAALMSAIPLLSQAAVVRSDYTLLSGNTWLADFTVINDGNPSQITAFTIYFPESRFGNLSLVGSPSTWDSLLIPPDGGLPAAGYLDSFVVHAADAIGAGGSQGGFRVQFDHLTGTTPAALSFDINDLSFNVVSSGTTLVSVVPEPATVLLASLGLGGLLAATRRQAGRALQRASEKPA